MMRQILIVSPHFPPGNAPDMHRVRLSLPYFEEFGWNPIVLSVGLEEQRLPVDPALSLSIPSTVRIVRTGALPLAWTHPLGIGNVALRAFGHLYRAGARLIREQSIDLVYISTTMFSSMVLGRLWKKRFGVPYVLDMQDPWFTGAYTQGPQSFKGRLAMALHGRMEPFTMHGVDGLIAVSADYVRALRARYSSIPEDASATLPFGVDENDFCLARRLPWQNPFFGNDDGLHIVYVGRVNADMRTAARVLFRALRQARQTSRPAHRIRLHFIGTDYAAPGQERKSIEPDAYGEGLGDVVRESPARVPYFEGLRVLTDAQCLLVLGSDDQRYTPSKLLPCMMAGRPIVAILKEGSPAIDVIRDANAGLVVTYSDADHLDGPVSQLANTLVDLAGRLPFTPATNPAALAPYSARELTRRQCLVFDAVMRKHQKAPTA